MNKSMQVPSGFLKNQKNAAAHLGTFENNRNSVEIDTNINNPVRAM